MENGKIVTKLIDLHTFYAKFLISVNIKGN